MWSMQLRLNDCFRQQRFPEPGYVSETISDLLTYMGVNARGAKSELFVDPATGDIVGRN